MPPLSPEFKVAVKIYEINLNGGKAYQTNLENSLEGVCSKMVVSRSLDSLTDIGIVEGGWFRMDKKWVYCYSISNNALEPIKQLYDSLISLRDPPEAKHIELVGTRLLEVKNPTLKELMDAFVDYFATTELIESTKFERGDDLVDVKEIKKKARETILRIMRKEAEKKGSQEGMDAINRIDKQNGKT